MKYACFWGFCLPFILTCSISADVSSLTGNIFFDSNNDGVAEMTLNAVGLGLGTGPTTESNFVVAGNAMISNALNVGGPTGSSNLNIHGTMSSSMQSISGNSTLGNHSIVFVDSSSQAFAVEVKLPDASNMSGRQYTIKKTSISGNVLIMSGTSNSSNVIDQSGHVILEEGALGALQVISNGTTWNATSSLNAIYGPPVSGANLIFWIDPSQRSSVTLDSSGNIAKLRDLSGRGHHLLPSGNAPIYKIGSEGINGVNCIYSDGGGLIHNNSGHGLSPKYFMSTFVVYQYISGASWSIAVNYGSGSSYMYMQRQNVTANMQIRIDNNGVGNQLAQNLGSVFDGSCHVFMFTLNAGTKNLSFYLDAGGIVSKTFSSLVAPLTFDNTINLGYSGTVCRIGEVLVFDMDLTAAERIALRNYLINKWGL